MREKNIYEKIAEKYNTTPEEVRREMQKAFFQVFLRGKRQKKRCGQQYIIKL